MTELLSAVGNWAWSHVWVPVALWTLLWIGFRLVWMVRQPAHPTTRYAIQWAMLAALPLGWVGAQVFYGHFPAGWTPPALAEAAISLVPVSTPTVASTDVSAAPWTAATWIGLFTVLVSFASLWRCGQLLTHGLTLRLWFRNLPTYRNAELQALADRLARETRIHVPVHVFVTPTPVVPMTFGWRLPIILLPETLLATTDDVRMTLLHELTHIRRRDFLLHVTEQALRAVFCFHPAVHHLCRNLAQAREQSCDAEVIRQPDVRHQAYAHLLLRLTPADAIAPAVALMMARSPSHLKTRTLVMKTLLHSTQPYPSGRRLRWYTALFGFALTCCITLSTTVVAQQTGGETSRIGVVPQVETLPSGIQVGTVVEGQFDEFLALRGNINAAGTTARVAIDRFYVNRIEANMTGAVRISSDHTCEALVASLDYGTHPLGDRYFAAELTTTCPAGAVIKAEQPIRARLIINSEPGRIQIPRGPFYQQTGGDWIFVVDASGTSASRRLVELGRQNPRAFEVIRGLEPGEKVVVSSYATYGNAQRINVQ